MTSLTFFKTTQILLPFGGDALIFHTVLINR
jgi:hypothetical protein